MIKKREAVLGIEDVSLGFFFEKNNREKVTLPQIHQYLEMDSQDERLYEMIEKVLISLFPFCLFFSILNSSVRVKEERPWKKQRDANTKSNKIAETPG